MAVIFGINHFEVVAPPKTREELKDLFSSLSGDYLEFNKGRDVPPPPWNALRFSRVVGSDGFLSGFSLHHGGAQRSMGERGWVTIPSLWVSAAEAPPVFRLLQELPTMRIAVAFPVDHILKYVKEVGGIRIGGAWTIPALVHDELFSRSTFWPSRSTNLNSGICVRCKTRVEATSGLLVSGKKSNQEVECGPSWGCGILRSQKPPGTDGYIPVPASGRFLRLAVHGSTSSLRVDSLLELRLGTENWRRLRVTNRAGGGGDMIVSCRRHGSSHSASIFLSPSLAEASTEEPPDALLISGEDL